MSHHQSSSDPQREEEGEDIGDTSVVTAGQSAALRTSTSTANSTVSTEGLALDRVNDILDFEVEHILYDRSTRLEHYECLAFFWNLHPARGLGYGRRFAILYLAELVVVACGRPPYEQSEETTTPESSAAVRFPSLYLKDRHDWDELEQELFKVRHILLRQDATVNYSMMTEAEPEASQVNETLENHKVFGKVFESVIRLVQIQKAMAPVRAQLEDRIAANVGNFSSSVGLDKVEEILTYLEEKVEDAHVAKAVLSLFATDDAGTAEQVPKYSFVEDEELVAKLRAEPFDLIAFQLRFESLILRMYDLVYPNDSSVLMDKWYAVQENTHLAEVLKVDRNHRRHQVLNRVFPPGSNNSATADEAAAETKRDPVARLFGQATLEIVEELEQDDQEEFLDKQSMSVTNKRPRLSAIRTVEGPIVPPDPGIFDDKGNVNKRLHWTDEEKECVKEGVRNHGIGRWVNIKKQYAEILRNRTSVQIKDCWRTLVKRGEVDFVPEDMREGGTRKRKVKVDPPPLGMKPDAEGDVVIAATDAPCSPCWTASIQQQIEL